MLSARSFHRSLLLVLPAALAPVAVMHAADFRIESRVFAGKEPKPVSENTTLFRAGIVYDYLANKHVAVFDKPRGRFLLLDPGRKLKTEVKTTELHAFCDRLQAVAAKDSNAFLKFVAEPHFEVTMNSDDDELSLISPYMTYRVKTMKADSEAAAQQVREFSDWYARLNVMTNPSGNPPFPRLALNDELSRRGLMAKEVQLTIPPQAPLKGRSMTLRSEHTITWKLLEDDPDRIATTDQQLATFKSVSLNDYRQDQVSKK